MALPPFFSTFGACPLLLLIWGFPQSIRVEVGALLPSSGTEVTLNFLKQKAVHI